MKRFYFSKLVILIAILSGWNMSVLAQTTFPVPNVPGCSGVSGVIVTMRGGGGGTSNSNGTGFPNGGPGGFGGSVACTLNVVTPVVITSLTYYVGMVGVTGTPVQTGTSGVAGGAGYGRGGNSGNFVGVSGGPGTDVAGGGGGGSSAVLNTTGGAVLLVAAGGGGGGALATSVAGGNGGNPGTAGGSLSPNFGGAGGTPGSGGAAGGVGMNYNGIAGGAVPPGNGGDGGIGLAYSQSGGGGGAGWGGGGGGGAGNIGATTYAQYATVSAAGGGGSNYVNPAAVTTGLTNGTATVGGNGIVTLTLFPAPIGGTCISLCAGGTTTFTETTPGGVWSSSNVAVASVSTSTGASITVTAGTTQDTATISYTDPASGYYAFVVVTVLGSPSPITGPTVLCVNQTINLSDALPGGTWTSGTPAIATVDAATGVVTGIAAGVDVITYTAPAGCPATYTVTVISQPTPVAGGAVCADGTILLTNTVPGGIWTSSNTTVATIDSTSGLVSGVSAGTTTITYAGGPTCYVTTTVTVNALPVISSADSTNPNSCGVLNGKIFLNGLTPGASYTVTYDYNGTPAPALTLTASPVTITSLDIGTYTNFIVTDIATECTSLPFGPVTLSPPPTPPRPVITSNQPICEFGILFLEATDSLSGGTFVWSGPDDFTSDIPNPSIIPITQLNIGVYSVYYNRFNCLSEPSSVDVTMDYLRLTNITPSQTIPYGATIRLNADNAYYYWWRPDDGTLSNPNINNPIAVPVVTTTYIVYGRSQRGCIDSGFVTITVDSTMNVGIPSAFTPDGDGLNDVFRPVGVRFQRIVDFRINNRWGQQVFYSNDIAHGWDGTFNGVPQDLGVYYYQIIIAQPGGMGENIAYKGNVLLVR